jgi:hypothetical protein
MQNFEKLGAFYLGRRVADAAGEVLDELVLYDSKDLTTHAAIIGMTGSGKTGLGIGLIEEAAMDRIPVIAIDPKGDLGNLLLTFPQFRGKDFEPWVDPRAAADKGQTVEEFAADQAAAWKNGLAASGQTAERVRQLKTNCDFTIYTPGSSAGVPLAILGEFPPPGAEVRADKDIYNDVVDGTATGLLSLLGIDADPVSSREHILITNILRSCWAKEQSLDLAGLIAAVQDPPFRKVGVIAVDTFFPQKQRFALAMQINNLLAAPGFAAWMEGDRLDIDALLYTDTGQPRVSVLSIAHLDDRERMFFVSMLLTALLAWMRRQTGSAALRAILYIDEIFGYMPPVENPPSKRPLLTLLKQARAFGLGVVLSTQNPVDLDYKGMSNMGSWFIGRLQTERDKQRVLEGLRSAAGAGSLESGKLSEMLSSLGKRCFLLHNVHETTPVLFSTRWVMSYLAGPLTRAQISLLSAARPEPSKGELERKATAAISNDVPAETLGAPVLEPGIKQTWLGAARMPREGEQLVYMPELLAEISVNYTSARPKIDTRADFTLCVEVDAADEQPLWAEGQELLPNTVQRFAKPAAGASYAECPVSLLNARHYAVWEKKLRSWVRTDRPLQLWKSAAMKVVSEPGESERDFRIRLQQLGNEQRDLRVAKLRQTYEAKVARLEDRLMTAEQARDREAEQASGSKLDTAISVGTAVLGALLGRKRVSATSVGRAGTAARRAGNMRKQMGDVKRAEEKIAKIEQDIEALKERFDADVEAMDDAYNAQTETLDELFVRARSTNIRINWMGLAWRPAFN